MQNEHDSGAMSVNQDLQRRLDRIVDTLETEAVPNPIEQVSHLILLKLVDEQEAKRETREGAGRGRDAGLFPLQAQRFRWKGWRDSRGEDLRGFLADEVFYYMASLSNEAPGVARHFRGASLDIADPDVLERLVDELDKIEFSEIAAEVRGGLFEYLLARLGLPTGSAEPAGRSPGRGEFRRPVGVFRTPPRIRALMVRMTDPDEGDSVYDPACGTAGFLIDAVNWIRERQSGSERVDVTIYGTDVSPNLVRIAAINLLLHGVPDAKLRSANALAGPDVFTEAELQRRHDVVLSNPPLLAQPPRGPVRRDLPATGRRGEILFLALAMQSLAPGGRCAVILPDSLLSGATKVHRELRATLLRRFEVQAVVSLPIGVFGPFARVRTSVVVFRRPFGEARDDAPATRRVWFYEVQNDGFDEEGAGPSGHRETPDQNDTPGLLEAWADYEASRFETPPGVEGGSFLEAGSEEPRCWWAPFEMVAEAECDLTGSRYRPFVDEPIPEEDPASLIREILELEREITAGFEALLDDLKGSP